MLFISFNLSLDISNEELDLLCWPLCPLTLVKFYPVYILHKSKGNLIYQLVYKSQQ